MTTIILLMAILCYMYVEKFVNQIKSNNTPMV